MKRLTILTLVAALIVPAMADTFGTGDNAFTIDFVPIGNPGNAADTGGTPGCGAVDYNYSIGKYEVTNAQWNTFTAAAGVPTGNDGGYSYDASWTGAQQPTNNVSWYEAAQFCNYLTSGDKSKGAYRFSGNNTNPGSFQGIDRVLSISTYGTTYVIPTEDEWYKAAYFKPDASGYSQYANGTSTPPTNGVNSNYFGAIGSPWAITNGTPEQNGTFDMMGNVWEWNETLLYGSNRGLRGGSYIYYFNGPDVRLLLASLGRNSSDPGYEGGFGFRVASIVPEPCTLLLLGLGGLLIRRK